MLNRLKREISWWYRSLSGDDASQGEISKQFIRTFLPDEPVVVEAGAYKGLDTEAMSRTWPDATIHAFEPIPQLYTQVVDRVGFRKNVNCHNVALGDYSGTTTIHISSGESDASSSILPPKEHLNYHPKTAFNKTIEVPVTTLRDWATEHGIDHIDFLWLDLQGAEFKVLLSSRDLIGSVHAIYMEVSLVEQYEGTKLYPDVRSFLEGMGFRAAREELAWKDAGNVLFIQDH